MEELIKWLESEKSDVIKAASQLNINVDMLLQHYDKIIRKAKESLIS